ncbi:MAG: citrate lyase holo-[acyl-carrier protein] synthase [Bacilli bacterium]|nr:citrate lyase holo-[acyl-carrier protein] synthase [Bacilli bacterium]
MNEESILAAREDRLTHIRNHLGPNEAIICIKANIPGEYKNSKEAYTLLSIFNIECQQDYIILDKEFVESADGPYILIKTPIDANIKKNLIDIETNHPLGRMIDLDYYVSDEKSVTRQSLGLSPRKCYLCNRDAIQCIREKTHSDKRIFTYIQTQVYAYVQDIIEHLVIRSIKRELDLEHKFGLVTPSSNGSHLDMNYTLMMRSAKALLFSFTQMFWIGFDGISLETIYAQGKKQGLAAEKLMYDVTNDVNTYKGLIFILGLALMSGGYAISHQQTLDGLFDNIRIMTKNIFEESNYQTFGEKAYREYQIGGAREEAYRGYPTVKKAMNTLLEAPIIDDEVLHMTLIDIIGSTDDTVLVKRAGSLEAYRRYKNLITNIKTYDLKTIIEVTEECIRGNISCGGAADILITALFLVDFSRKLLIA